jgi:hypothetical protein
MPNRPLQRIARIRASAIRSARLVTVPVLDREMPDPLYTYADLDVFPDLEVILRQNNLPYALDAYVRQQHAQHAADYPLAISEEN